MSQADAPASIWLIAARVTHPAACSATSLKPTCFSTLCFAVGLLTIEWGNRYHFTLLYGKNTGDIEKNVKFCKKRSKNHNRILKQRKASRGKKTEESIM